MVNGKPLLIFGEGAAAPARARASAHTAGKEGHEKSFASFLPGNEAAQAGHKSVERPARRGAPRSLNKVGDMQPQGNTAGIYASVLASPLAGSFSVNDAPIDLDAPVKAASSHKTRSPARRTSMANNLTEARPPMEGGAMNRMGSIGMGRKAVRRTATPVTGRAMGIGMEDTRNRGTIELQKVVSPHAPAQVPTGAGAVPGRQAGGLDMSNPRNAAMLARVLEQEKDPLKALNALPPGTRIGEVPGVRKPEGNPGAFFDTHLAPQSRKTGADLGRQSRLLPGPSTQAMFGAFNDARQSIHQAQQAGEELGVLAARYESGEDGIAAIGYDRNGGTSYGKFQISSRAGSMKSFIDYLKENAPDLASRLAAAGPANTGGKRGRMPAVWRQIAGEQPERFEELQTDFIRVSHFEPAMEAIAGNTGVAFEKMPTALQEVLFSTAVQHGPSGAARIVSRAVSRVGAGHLAQNPEMEGFTRAGRALIKQIYAIRAGQFGSSTEELQAAVQNRLTSEMREALAMFGKPQGRG